MTEGLALVEKRLHELEGCRADGGRIKDAVRKFDRAVGATPFGDARPINGPVRSDSAPAEAIRGLCSVIPEMERAALAYERYRKAADHGHHEGICGSLSAPGDLYDIGYAAKDGLGLVHSYGSLAGNAPEAKRVETFFKRMLKEGLDPHIPAVC